MTPEQERRFRRILRWYPAAWRREHGDVLLGTLLDAADADGRTAPTVAERASAAVHGLGTRLDARAALVAGAVGLAASGAAAAMVLLVLGTEFAVALGWAQPFLGLALGSSAVVVGVVALLRSAGALEAPRALGTAVLASGALLLGAFAQLGWSIGFDAADAGRADAGPLGDGWYLFFLGGVVVGAVAAGLLADGLLRRTAIGRAGRLAFAIVLGPVAAVTVGMSLISPMSGVAAAIALVIVTLVLHRPPPSETVARPVRTAGPDRGRRPARVLAWLATAVGALGIASAATAQGWPGMDGTDAVILGITVCLAAALPLIVAAAVRLSARSRLAAANVWGPAGAAALACVATMVAYRDAPDAAAMQPALLVSGSCVGLVAAWLLAVVLPGARTVRLAIGAGVGVVLALTIGMWVALMLAFVVPVLALLLATFGTRRPRGAATVDRAVAPHPA